MRGPITPCHSPACPHQHGDVSALEPGREDTGTAGFPPCSALGKQPLRRCDNKGFIKESGEEQGRAKSCWWQLPAPSREGTRVPLAPAPRLHPGSGASARQPLLLGGPRGFSYNLFCKVDFPPSPSIPYQLLERLEQQVALEPVHPRGNKIPEKERSKEPVPPHLPMAAEIQDSKHPSHGGQVAPDSLSLAGTLSQNLVITWTRFLPKILIQRMLLTSREPWCWRQGEDAPRLHGDEGCGQMLSLGMSLQGHTPSPQTLQHPKLVGFWCRGAADPWGHGAETAFLPAPPNRRVTFLSVPSPSF